MRQTTETIRNALLTGPGARVVELWTFYLSSGTKRWATWPTNVTVGGTTWTAGEVVLGKGRWFTAVGTGPISLSVSIAGPVVLSGSTIIQSALGVTFRGVRVVLQWLVLNAAGEQAGLLDVFDGHADAPKTTTNGGVELTVKGLLSSSSNRRGEVPIEVSCPLVLYGPQCGATRTEVSATALAGCTSTSVSVTPNPLMVVGSLVIMPDGSQAFVRSSAGGGSSATFVLDRTVPVATAGQTIRFVKGCPKTFTTCGTYHNNKPHYLGMPWQPAKSITQD